MQIILSLTNAVLDWGQRLPFVPSLLLVVLGVAVGCGAVVMVLVWVKGPVNERVIEGVRLVPAAKLSRLTIYRDKTKRVHQLVFGQVPWPLELEDKHALIVGTTGVGKSTLIRQLLSKVRDRGGRAIVVDLNGDFCTALGVPNDKRFNPFDSASVKWNPLHEIRQPDDIDLVLKAAIPTGTTSEDENWRGYGRQFLRAIMVRLHEAGELRLDRLRHFVMDAGEKELAAFLQTGSQPYRIQANSMASTVKSIAQSCIQSLAHASDEPNFSIRDWVRRGEGFIFITPRDRDRAALTTLVNAFVNLAVAESLSAPSGKRFRPISVVVDELASFDLDNLEGVLEKGRKFGLVAFAGIQNIAQLRKKYGPDGATTLLACFRTKVVFNPGDGETAKRMAEELGKQTVERREVSHSHSSGHRTTTEHWRREERFAVSPEDLQGLPDLTAFLKLGGDFPVARILVPRVPSP